MKKFNFKITSKIEGKKSIIAVVAAETIIAVVAAAIVIAVVFSNVINPILKNDAEQEQKGETDSHISEEEEEFVSESDSDGTKDVSDAEVRAENAVEIKNENWAEDFYRDVVCIINYQTAMNSILDTRTIKDIYATGGTRDSRMFVFESCKTIFDKIRNYNSGTVLEYERSTVVYYTKEEVESNSLLSKEDKEIIKGMFVDEFSTVTEYPSDWLRDALDFFFGKNRYGLAALSDGKNFYLCSNGMSFFVQTFDGIGSAPYDFYYRLINIEYEGNEAVLSLNILIDDPSYVCLYDGVTRKILSDTKSTEVYGMDNDAAFELLCSENNIDKESLSVAKLRIGIDENGTYIIGWEGNIPKNAWVDGWNW